MSIVTGTNQRLFMDDKPDSDGEMNISMPIHSDDGDTADTWINKEMAIEIIAHLTAVFEI